MFLAVDIGNTRTTFGVFDENGHLQKKWDCLSFPSLDGRGLGGGCIPGGENVSFAGIASVVPDLTSSVVNFLKSKYPGISLTEISVELNTGLEFCVENPKEIGADRIANCAYAFRRYGYSGSPRVASPKAGMTKHNLLIIDMGTAITFDCVTAQGQYLGGLIYPGIETSFKNLFEKAARLESIVLEKPKYLIGRNTQQHIQSGFYYGTKNLINGLIHDYKKELGELFVVATGGHSNLLLKDASFSFDAIDPDLTLKGIHLLCSN